MSELDNKKLGNKLSGWMQIVKSDSLASIVARQFIPIAIAVPLAMDGLIQRGEIAGWYDSNVGRLLIELSLVLIALALIGRTAVIINKIDGDRKRSDDRLRRSEERLQLALTGSNQGIWDWDLKTEVLTWDDRCKKIFGLASDFPVTYEWHINTLHPDDRQRVSEAATIAIRDRTEFNEEYRTFHPDGTIHWILAQGRSYYDESGEPYRMLGTVMDISDRKQIEESLLQSKAHIQRLASNIPGVLYQYVLHSDGSDEFTYISSKAEEIYELTIEELQRDFSQVWEMIHPDDLERVQAINTASAQHLSLFNAEFRLVMPSGQIKWVQAQSQPERLENGDVIWDGLITDISDRKQAESAFVRTNTVLQTVINGTRDVIYVKDLQGRYVLANQAAAIWLNTTVESILGQDDLALFPDDIARQIQTADQKVIENEEFITYEEQLLKGDELRSLLSAKYPWRNELGEVVGLIGISIDVTDLKQAEADLKKRNDYIQILYEISRDLLSTYEPLTLVDVLFNKLKPLIGLDIYFNYIVDEQQQKLHLMFHGGISEEMAREIEWLEIGQAICGTVAQQRCQIIQPNLQQSTDPKTELVRSLGLTAYSCQPLISQGKLFGTLGFGSLTRTEFTTAETKLFQAICDRIAIALDRSELVSSLQQQTEELKRANRLKDEFLAALSHELRTPLNPILGWTKLLQTQNLTTAKTKEALSTIERNVKQQMNLVEDLLDISRVVQGQFQLASQPVDLETILNAAGESVRFAAIAKSITLEYYYPSNPIRVMGDETRLQQVFWNLLSNAVKFTPDGGKVDIWLEQVQNTAQIRITDTGIGISPEFLPHVFERFRQADGSTTRQYGGLGLGLALVKHLVELHGGTVTAASLGEDKGATFKVALPSLQESTSSNLPATSDLQQQPAIDSGSLSGIRALVVDDQPDNLDLVEFVLTQEGAIVTAVTSATEALAIVSKNPPDILISDIGMSEMDGYELLQRIRALPNQQDKPLKAIALTAFAQQEDQEKAIAVGFQAYLSKPVNLTDLVTAIAEQVISNE